MSRSSSAGGSKLRVQKELIGSSAPTHDPAELRRQIRAAVEGKLDREKWERAIQVECAELQSIVECMRERLRLVNGELSIQSESGRGTTVLARLPHGDERHSMAVAG